MNKYSGETKIKVDMICKCGNVCELPGETSPYSSNGEIRNVILFYDHIIYICNQCGKEMSRRVTKIETETTEIVIN